ncbi:hypothetical protein [Mastigocladopsis repens]|nr:hypothetical protein [Mastigocladopsis repens]
MNKLIMVYHRPKFTGNSYRRIDRRVNYRTSPSNVSRRSPSSL